MEPSQGEKVVEMARELLSQRYDDPLTGYTYRANNLLNDLYKELRKVHQVTATLQIPAIYAEEDFF